MTDHDHMQRPPGKGLGAYPRPKRWTGRSTIPMCACDAPRCKVCGHRKHISLHMHALGEQPGDPPFDHEYQPLDTAMTDRIIYVLGFAFTPDERVALIQKRKPEWQSGLFNGIGGKVEPNETSGDAMRREFREETGVDIDNWQYRGRMYGETWSVFVFSTVHPDVADVRTVTDEEVALFASWDIGMIDNVRALIELCLLEPSQPSNVVPHFELNYSERG